MREMSHFSAERHLFIGIDGGGSGCRARIADQKGRVLGAGQAAPAALRIGIDLALAEVRKAAQAAVADSGLPENSLAEMHAVVGLAGIGRRKSMRKELNARPHPFRSVVYVNDALIACLGAHRGHDGGVVVAGTGSVGFALIDGREIRVGGYGFPISDEGSGAELGVRAIRYALRASDGRIPHTDLTLSVMARFDNDSFEVVGWSDRASATDYAKFAPLVMDHAEHGDPVAREIVTGAAHEIDVLVRTISARGVARIALLGGLAPRLERWLAPDARELLVPSAGDALDGALTIARETFVTSHEPQDET